MLKTITILVGNKLICKNVPGQDDHPRRYDYKEFLELGLLILGETAERKKG